MADKIHHPRGLSTLFFTEMWERFSYYGMRAFLILYMTAPVVAGGLGFPIERAASIYGTYTGSAWAASIAGGIIADRMLGQYRSVLIGGIIIAAGHFTLAFRALPFFYSGLALIVIGTGLLKPNVSALVGSLYEEGDARRDAGFSIFYMGINLGAFLGPIIGGYLAQNVDWHVGFASAGIGMTLGLVQYILGKERLRPAIKKLAALHTTEAKASTAKREGRFTVQEWSRLATVAILFVFAAVFWGAYEQSGSTLNLFADRYTRLTIFGLSFPSSWFQAVPAIFVIVLAPVMAALWVRLGSKEPSSPAKFAIGLLFAGLSFLFLIPAASTAQLGTRVSPWWLVGAYFIIEIGELSLSPVGLSVVTKLAPARIVGVMMGVWLLSIAVGDKLAGWTAGFFNTLPLTTLFGYVAVVTLVAAGILAVLIAPIRKLMGGIR